MRSLRYGGVEFTMNQLAGGWWQSKMLLLDPDLVVFNKNLVQELAPSWLRPFVGSLSMDSRSRVNKAVVHGGFYIAGDDFKNSTSAEMAGEFLNNEDVNAVVWEMKGASFRPVRSADKFLVAPNTFEYGVEGSGKAYLAVFNYNRGAKTIEIDVKGDTVVGKMGEVARVVDVWTGEEVEFGGEGLEVKLGGATSVLYKFEFA